MFNHTESFCFMQAQLAGAKVTVAVTFLTFPAGISYF